LSYSLYSTSDMNFLTIFVQGYPKNQPSRQSINFAKF
jgi:hypothetical protein